MEKLPPIHPGEILREEFLIPYNLSAEQLSRDINLPVQLIKDVIEERASITADIALRLAQFFSTTELFWLNLQVQFDLELERDRSGDVVAKEVRAFQGA